MATVVHRFEPRISRRMGKRLQSQMEKMKWITIPEHHFFFFSFFLSISSSQFLSFFLHPFAPDVFPGKKFMPCQITNCIQIFIPYHYYYISSPLTLSSSFSEFISQIVSEAATFLSLSLSLPLWSSLPYLRKGERERIKCKIHTYRHIKWFSFVHDRYQMQRIEKKRIRNSKMIWWGGWWSENIILYYCRDVTEQMIHLSLDPNKHSSLSLSLSLSPLFTFHLLYISYSPSLSISWFHILCSFGHDSLHISTILWKLTDSILLSFFPSFSVQMIHHKSCLFPFFRNPSLLSRKKFFRPTPLSSHLHFNPHFLLFSSFSFVSIPPQRKLTPLSLHF